MEIKRIFLSRKVVILFILVILINAGWYLNEEKKTWDFNYITIQKAADYQKNYLKQIEKMSPREAADFLEKKNNQLENDMISQLEQDQKLNNDYYHNVGESEIVGQLEKQMTYLDGFQKQLKEVQKQAGVMSTISIFQKEDSFSSKNIAKTVQDYKSLEGISLERGTNQPIVNTLFDPVLRFLNIFFVFAIVLSFIEERKCGLWEKVHTSVKGRGSLAIRRGFVLIVGSFMIQLITLVERLVLSSYLYGNPELGRLIQSIPEFKDFVYPMSILSYIIFYWIISSLAGFCLGLFLWLILSVFLNRVLSFGVICIVEALEWLAYAFIPIQSWVGFLKYFNLFYLINPTKQLAAYSNISFFGQPVERLQVLIITLLVMGILFFILSVWVNQRKKPVQIPGRAERVIGKVIRTCGNHIRKLFARFSISWMEHYKIFGPQKGWVILIIMILFLVNGSQKYNIFFGAEQNALNEFYDDYGGKLDEKAFNKMKSMARENKKAEDAYAKVSKDYAKGKIDKEEMDRATWLFDRTATNRGVQSIIEAKVERLKGLEEKRKIEPWLVNDIGYNLMLGEKGFPRQLSRAMIELFVLILLLSAIFSQEQLSGMKIKIRTTKKGRFYFWSKKIEVILLYSFLVNLLVWAFEWIYYSMNFPLHNLSAPIQSLDLFEDITFSCSIGGFLMILFMLRWILLIAVGNIISFFSVHFSQIATLCMTTMIFLGPAALLLLGVPSLEKVSVANLIAFMEIFLGTNRYGGLVVGIIIFLLIGIVSFIFSGYYWCEGRNLIRKEYHKSKKLS